MLFVADEHNEAFKRDGYLILPFLNQPEVEALLTYHSTLNEEQADIQPSHDRQSPEVNRKVSAHIEQVFQEKNKAYCAPVNFVVGHFMTKYPAKANYFHLHQDWSYVDESQYQSAQMWVPLVDTNPTNGGMFILTGSHRWFNNLRSGGFPISFVDLTPELENYVVQLQVPAGHCLFYHPALFHGSYPNHSTHKRVVAYGAIVENNAPLLFYSQQGPNALPLLISPDFFLTELQAATRSAAIPQNKGTLPTFAYTHRPITLPMVLQKLSVSTPDI